MPVYYLTLFWSIILSLGLSQCTYIDKKNEIINTWQVSNIEIKKPQEDTTEFTPENLPRHISQEHFKQKNILYIFRSDSTYQIQHGNLVDEGTWVFSQDETVLLLKSSLHDEDNAEFLIQSFTAYQMILLSEQNEVQEILTLEALD